MKKSFRLGTSLLLAAALLAQPCFAQSSDLQAPPPAPSGGAAAIDPQIFLTQAGMAYYNLRSAGLGGFQCAIQPDWNAMLAEQRKQDPEATDETIRFFSTLNFTVSVAADGRTVLNHDQVVTDSRRLAEAIEQLISGMENVTYGFFSTWVLFAMAAPLPNAQATGLRIEPVDAQFRLSYREGPADMVINLNHDFAIQAIRLSQPGFHTVTEPVFQKTHNGFELLSYDYLAETGEASIAQDFHVHVTLAYQHVDGFELPQRLDVKGAAAGAPFEFSLVLSDCQVVRSADNPAV